ncbi:MAG: SH3 domain-containing protein [Candidatus Caenarcaniphilales bacterium]|nr:SH3 domain-containing protein [Candidatus Caenarcaniphilales bacterium]
MYQQKNRKDLFFYSSNFCLMILCLFAFTACTNFSKPQFATAKVEDQTAQVENDESSDMKYIFGDSVNVRQKPGLKGKVISQIKIGTRILPPADQPVEADGETWINISHGDTDEYIAESQIALAGLEYERNKLLLVGNLKQINKDKMQGSFELRQVDLSINPDKPKIIHQNSYPISLDGTSGYFGEAKLRKDPKLPIPLASFKIGYPACGYVQTTTYFYPDPKTGDWEIAFKTEDVADGGAFDNHHEITFPSDKGGSPNQIKVQLIESVWDDKLNDMKIVKKNPVKIYRWDGKVFMPQ